MKKTLMLFILALFTTSLAYAQPKVNITLNNPRVLSGYFAMDVVANVQAGQTWKVGSSNIRIAWTSAPAAGISIKTDNPVVNANTNMTANANYSAMTTTSILSGTAISLNITRLNNCHTLTTGTYVLGTIRFNRLDTTSLVNLTINSNSVMQDSITQLQNPAGWTFTNPPPGIPIITGVSDPVASIPTEFNIYQNYPNPFNPSTKIKFDIPAAGINGSHVKLFIYNSLGKEVAVLVNEKLEPGSYEYTFEGSKLSSGTYFYRLEAGDFVETKRMILIK